MKLFVICSLVNGDSGYVGLVVGVALSYKNFSAFVFCLLFKERYVFFGREGFGALGRAGREGKVSY